MSNSWFRFYHEALDDPKVQRLPPEIFKFWVNLLCLICRNDGTLPDVETIAYALRIHPSACLEPLDYLASTNLITKVVNQHGTSYLPPPSWQERQYISDTSTERVKRFRKRFRNVTCNAPDTEQNRTDKERYPIGYQPPLPPMEKKLPEKTKPKKKNTQVEKREDPDWLPREFSDYVEFRKKTKSPLTEHARELAIRELEKLKVAGNDPAKVLNQSILRGWKGLFPLKGDDHDASRKNQTNGHQHPQQRTSYAAQVRDASSAAIEVFNRMEGQGQRSIWDGIGGYAEGGTSSDDRKVGEVPRGSHGLVLPGVSFRKFPEGEKGFNFDE